MKRLYITKGPPAYKQEMIWTANEHDIMLFFNCNGIFIALWHAFLAQQTYKQWLGRRVPNIKLCWTDAHVFFDRAYLQGKSGEFDFIKGINIFICYLLLIHLRVISKEVFYCSKHDCMLMLPEIGQWHNNDLLHSRILIVSRTDKRSSHCW